MAPKAAPRTYERINITLPRETVGLLGRVTTKGTRSRFIDEAIHRMAKGRSRAQLRKVLEEGYRARARRDLHMVEEWFPLEEEVWGRAEVERRRR